MTRSLLANHYRSIPRRLMFQYPIPPRLRDTLIQILWLAPTTPPYITQPLTIRELSEQTGKAPGTLLEHLFKLRKMPDLVSVQTVGGGRYVLTFKSWLFPPSPESEADSGNPDFSVKEEEVLTGFPDSEKNLLLNAPKTEIQNWKSRVKRRAARLRPRTTPEFAAGTPESDLAQKILKAGVFPALLSEVFNRGRSLESLTALLEWCQAEQPEAPAKLFMARLRLGAEAPPAFFNPPCPRCGSRAAHLPDCPARYTSGEFADFVEH